MLTPKDTRQFDAPRLGPLTKAFRSAYPNPGDSASDIVAKIIHLKNHAESYRQGLFRGKGLVNKLISDWNFYKGYDAQQGEIDDVRFSTRMIYRMVRTVTAELLRGEPLPRVEADRLSDREREQLLNAVLREQSKLANTMSPLAVFTFDKVLHGAGLMRLDWCEKTRPVKRRQVIRSPFGGPPTIVEMNSEETFFKGPVLRNVELFNFFWDPDGIDMETCGWVMERDATFTASDVLAYLEGGVFQVDKKTMKELESQTGVGLHGGRGLEDDKRRDYNTADPTDRSQAVFTLDRYYTDDHIFYVLNDTWVMNQDPEFQENPFMIRHSHRKPYIYSRLYDTGEFLGEGLAEIVGGYQYYASIAVKLELKQLYSNLRRKLLLEKGSIEDLTKVYSEVDDAIIVNDINGVRPLEPLRTIGAALDFADRITRQAETESGVTRMMQGQMTPGNTTATEAAEIADQIDKQTAFMVRNQVAAAREYMTMACEYNYLFLDTLDYTWRGRPVHITNELFDTSDLTVDVVPESFIANVSALKQKRLEIFAQSVMNRPYINWLAIDYSRAKAAGLDPAEVITAPMPMPGPGSLPNPLNEEVTGTNMMQVLGGPPQQGAPANPGALGGPAGTNGPAVPGSPSPALQELNPMGIRGGGQPNSALGESAREAVLGQ